MAGLHQPIFAHTAVPAPNRRCPCLAPTLVPPSYLGQEGVRLGPVRRQHQHLERVAVAGVVVREAEGDGCGLCIQLLLAPCAACMEHMQYKKRATPFACTSTCTLPHACLHVGRGSASSRPGPARTHEQSHKATCMHAMSSPTITTGVTQPSSDVMGVCIHAWPWAGRALYVGPSPPSATGPVQPLPAPYLHSGGWSALLNK